jgi:PAS domain S-box-containing protein
MFDDPGAAGAAHRYLMETAPVLALKLDSSVHVVEANAEAIRLLGDRCIGRPLAEDLLSSADLGALIEEGDQTVHRLRFRTASGAAETVCFRFFALSGGTLALGNLDLHQLRKQTAESIALNRALREITGQLDRANAELFSLNETKDKFAREMKEHEEDLHLQTLALLNLLEDAKAARAVAERANRELSASEARFRSLVEGAPDAIYVITKGRFRFLNAAACRLFGVDSPEQLIGTAVMDRVAPSFRELAIQRASRLEESDEPAPPVEGELLSIDGRPIPVDITALPFVFEGERSGLVFARDLTERKQAAEALKRSEQSYRAILESAPDAIVLMNDLGRILLVNSRAENMFGRPRSELLTRNVNDLLPEKFRRLHWGALDDSRSSIEIRGLRENGEEFPIEISISLLESGEDSLVLGAIRDVSERKEAEQRSREFEIAMAEALAANSAKSMFLSTISHEIRTPMNAIMGYSQLMLREAGLSPTAKANLRVINRSGEHLLQIINDVLDMAKVEVGRLDSVPSKFYLPDFLRDLEAMFRLSAEAKSIRFEMSLEGEQAHYIVADEGRVRQVLINLLGNAIKFTDRGRIAFNVLLHKDAAGQMWLRASIQDTGVGISPEEQTNLFQPFVQGQAGQRRTRGGTGLGLAISRGIARVLGGDVTVSSRLGEGSTFVLEIPVEPDAGPASEDRRRRRRVVRVAEGFENRRILVADDGADNRQWLSQLLSGLGFQVYAVENGQSALDAWNWWKPHLILMDVHMPVMDGLEAARLIKAQPGGQQTAIVALTADVGAEQRRRALENRMDDFLPKPCSEHDLLGKIGALLNVSYLYEDSDPANRRPAADPPSDLSELPAALVEELRTATLRGDKALLNRLIPPSAKALQDLADNYQYDRLLQLLDQACPR